MSNGWKFLDPVGLSKLANLNFVARLVVEGFVTGLHRSPYHGFSVEFADHREYVQGDPIKHIDWKVFSRTDRYYIKQYEEETNLKIYLLLDCSSSMGYKSEKISKLEYGSFLAAALSYLMVKQQDSAGLITFAEKIGRFIPPRSSPTHLRLIMDELEKAKPGGETDIGSILHQLAEKIRRRGVVIVISDLLDEPDKVIGGLRHFRHKKHEVIVFHTLDRYELDFPFRRMSLFEDMETGDRLLADPLSLHEEYVKRMGDFINAYKEGCFESDIDYIPAETSQPYDLLLSSYLSRRAKAG